MLLLIIIIMMMMMTRRRRTTTNNETQFYDPLIVLLNDSNTHAYMRTITRNTCTAAETLTKYSNTWCKMANLLLTVTKLKLLSSKDFMFANINIYFLVLIDCKGVMEMTVQVKAEDTPENVS